jgi:phage tail protein X
MEATEYITKDGDRLDLLAFKAYGTISSIIIDGKSRNAMDAIIDLNPDINFNATFESGIRLYIPVVDSAALNNSLLPPWKQP